MIKVIQVNKDGRLINSYTCTDGARTIELTKENLIPYIQHGQVVNAKLTWYNGKPIIRIKEGGVPIKKNSVSVNLSPDGVLSIQGNGRCTQQWLDDTRIKKVIIGEGITHLEYGAFRGCVNIKEVLLGHTIKYIEGAFENCTSLRSIRIPASVKQWGYAFAGCENLEVVVIDEGIEAINSYAFEDCFRITSIHLPKQSLKRIDNMAFNGAKYYGDFYVPYSVKTIGEQAFDNFDCVGIIYLPKHWHAHLFKQYERIQQY